MNRKKLRENYNKRVRLDPPAIVERNFEKVIGTPDDLWWIKNAANDFFDLDNERTGRRLKLPYDHIREYLNDASGTSDGTLVLKVSVHLEPNKTHFKFIRR